jgi:aminoglycoside phosphotransferase (APT) family kinase protein
MTRTIREAAGDAVDLPWQDVRVRLRPVLTYQSNRLYDAHLAGRRLIVKEFLKPEEFHDAPVREFQGLRLLAPLDAAPQPLLLRPPDASGNGTGRPLVVYEYMPGKMWDRRRPSPQDLATLADLWLTVNGVSAANLWPSRGFQEPLQAQMARFAQMMEAYSAWARDSFPAGVPAAELSLATLRRHAEIVDKLERLPAPYCFCRADARFANVIARPDRRLGMVDWEDCGLRDPALDLADIITAPNQEDLLTWVDWQPFLEPYLAGHKKRDPDLAQRMHFYLALFPLAWLAWLLNAGVEKAQDGRLDDWRIHEMAPNHKLRRYLARAQAWPAPEFEDGFAALKDVRFFP